MSAKRKKPRKAAIDRPFDPKIMKRAREIAATYQVIVHFEDGEWYGRGVEMPFAMNDGKTPDECVTNTRDAFASVVALMLEKGETPPAPAVEEMRDQQVNVRLTSEEKIRLEASSKQAGFRGVSDYVRFKALAKA